MNEEIIAKIIGVEDRFNVLPFHLRKHILYFESGACTFTQNICKEYSDCYWEFLGLSNGGFYIRPNSDERFSIVREVNDYKGKVTADALGIIVSLLSINTLIFYDDSEALIEKYNQLKDYACQHAEKEEILSTIH